MKKHINTLVDNYIQAEQQLVRELQELRNGGQKCNCDEREFIETVAWEDHPEVGLTCGNCGGDVAL